jgi:hypothetical protein
VKNFFNNGRVVHKTGIIYSELHRSIPCSIDILRTGCINNPGVIYSETHRSTAYIQTNTLDGVHKAGLIYWYKTCVCPRILECINQE